MKTDIITIRKATRNDSDLISNAVAMALGEESSLYYCGEDYLGVFKQIAEMEISQYSFQNTIIAEVDGSPVGAVVSYDGGRLSELRCPTLSAILAATGKQHEIPDETEVGELYLDSLCVLPEFRGQGIGKRLIQAVKERAKEIGLPIVGLLVDFENPKAEKLYSSLGFVRAGIKDFLGHPMYHMVYHEDQSGKE